MKKLSDEKMQELENAILDIEKEKAKDKQEKKVVQLWNILAFNYPTAGQDLIDFTVKERGLFTDKELKMIVDAVIEKRLSEDDFILAVERYRYCFGTSVEKNIVQAVACGELSLRLFYRLLFLTFFSLDISFEPIVQAVLDRKISPDVLLALQKMRYSFLNEKAEVAQAYLLGILSLKDMRLLIKEGFVFSSFDEKRIISSVVKGEHSVDILMPFLEEKYLLSFYSRQLFIQSVIEKKLSFHLLLMQKKHRDCWCNEAVLPVCKAVSEGKFSDSYLLALLENNADIIRRSVWMKLFRSKNYVCVAHYLREFYPELLSKL